MTIERADVVIVGGGLLGLATAWALRDRREVVVLEHATVGHTGGGSHGPSRVFRLGYEDPFYVRMAQLALPRWRALEAVTDASLLEVTGQLSFGDTDAVARAMRECAAPAQRLDVTEIVAAFPPFAGHGGALYEPASGVIAADRTLEVLRNGVDVRERCAVTAIGDGEVQTEQGTFDANVVVLTAGPWTRSLRGDLVPPDMYATREHVAYLRPRIPVDAMPVFIDYDARVYGLPTPGNDVYKIALHHGGTTVEPDHAHGAPDPAAVAALEAAARTWLPEHELVEVDSCIYDNTPNEDFVLHRAGDVVVGAGTSGHGFKFGPLLGEVLAALVEGTEPPVDLARFDPLRRRV